jgi:hypothetical protein
VGLLATVVLVFAACYRSLDEFSGGGRPDGGALGSESGVVGNEGDDDGGGASRDGGRFCEDQAPDAHTLCDDFDGYRDASWTLVEQYNGANLAASQEAFVSGPSSLLVTVPSVTNAETGGTLVKSVSAAATSAHVEADVKGCAFDRGFAALLYFESRTAAANNGVVAMGIWRSAASPFRLETYVGAFRDDSEVLGPAGEILPADRFVHVVFDVTFHPTAGVLKLSVDGTVRVNLTGVSTSASTSALDRTFHAGVFTEEASACAIRIDNVVLDVK